MGLSKTFTAGVTVIAAADMNGLQAPWTDYTPTVTNFTIGNGTLVGRYLQIGKTYHLRIYFAAGTTTTYGGSQMQISLPATAHATGNQTMLLRLASTGAQLAASVTINGGASVMNLEIQTSTSNSTLIGMSSSSPNPGTTGNLIVEGTYEAA